MRGVRTPLVLAALLATNLGLTGCAGLQARAHDLIPRGGYLPPPPKSLTQIATLQSPDTLSALHEEARLSAELRDSLAGRREVAPGAPVVVRERGLLRRRFATRAVYPADIGDDDRETMLMREREDERGIAAGWSRIDDTEQTLILNQSWGILRSVLRSGNPVSMRETVWPTPVRVVTSPMAERIRLEAGWIPLERIAPNELRCVTTGSDALRTPVVPEAGLPAVRLIAVIQAAEYQGRSAVTSGTEFRGVSSCTASPVWSDRVAEFGFDAWMAAERAVKLGGMPIINR